MGQYTSPRAKAGKELQVLVVPEDLVADASVTQQRVGKGNLCRIEGTAGGFVMFQDEGDATAASISTKETLKTELGFFVVISTKDFIRTSALMRIEVTKD